MFPWIRYFLSWFVISFVGLCFEAGRKGGPWAGFFTAACLWAIWGLLINTKVKERPRRRLWIGLIAALVVIGIDQTFQGDFFDHIETMNKTAARPFDGTQDEKSAHSLSAAYFWAMLGVYLAGTLFVQWTFFKPEGDYCWSKVRQNLLPKMWDARREWVAYILGGLVFVYVDVQGHGPILATYASLPVVALVYCALNRTVWLPRRMVANAAFSLFFLVFIIPHYARARERSTLLTLAAAAEDEATRNDLLRQADCEGLSEEELRVVREETSAKLANWTAVIFILPLGFSFFWLRQGLKEKARLRFVGADDALERR